ncbi:MAG: rhomboid family intramembrane serine protease [Paracoccus sp. (in: a-proteobacteria)]
MNESPFNQLPAVVWLLAMPVIASEAVFGLGRLGLIGGAEGVGLRLAGLQKTAFAPEMLWRMWETKSLDFSQLCRILTYPFIHYSLLQALFVLAFTLALGNMVARLFRPWAMVVLFLGSAAGGALVYTLAMSFLPDWPAPLIGGYPAVYGLVGVFTFVLWMRLTALNANRLRAFSLIGILLMFQLVFGIVSGGAGYDWIAEIAGFATGFGLSFVLVDGGLARVLHQIRQR